jgi:hypothetical protein
MSIMAKVYSAPPAPPHKNAMGQASTGYGATQGIHSVANSVTIAHDVIKRHRASALAAGVPPARRANTSLNFPIGHIATLLPNPLADTNRADPAAPKPKARP